MNAPEAAHLETRRSVQSPAESAMLWTTRSGAFAASYSPADSATLSSVRLTTDAATILGVEQWSRSSGAIAARLSQWVFA